MREPYRTYIYFGLFWAFAAAGLVLFVLGNEGLAEVAAGAALVALAWALVFDYRRRHPR